MKDIYTTPSPPSHNPVETWAELRKVERASQKQGRQTA